MVGRQSADKDAATRSASFSSALSPRLCRSTSAARRAYASSSSHRWRSVRSICRKWLARTPGMLRRLCLWLWCGRSFSGGPVAWTCMVRFPNVRVSRSSQLARYAARTLSGATSLVRYAKRRVRVKSARLRRLDVGLWPASAALRLCCSPGGYAAKRQSLRYSRA